MRPLALIVKAGLIAGLLDIIAALLVYGLLLSKVPAQAILQSIASGIYGSKAFTGGWNMALQGLLFHFLIAIVWAGVFYLLIQLIPALRRHWVGAGVLFGVVVWSVMNLLILPASQVTQRPVTFQGAVVGMLILVFCVGLPVSATMRGR
jgi:uncharacterized membrane protein YagU involved in acid resistance